MTSEHCQRILDNVTICRHFAVEFTFLYYVNPGLDRWCEGGLGQQRNEGGGFDFTIYLKFRTANNLTLIVIFSN